MSEEKLTWREVQDAWERGEETATGEIYFRLQGEELQSRKPGVSWERNSSAFTWLRRQEWRRAPKTPRVHELPERWRQHVSDRALELATLRCCANELEAALRDDELVSLKGVTAVEVEHAWYANERVANAFHFALNYLRERAKKGGE